VAVKVILKAKVNPVLLLSISIITNLKLYLLSVDTYMYDLLESIKFLLNDFTLVRNVISIFTSLWFQYCYNLKEAFQLHYNYLQMLLQRKDLACMEDGSLGQILAIAIGNFDDFLSFYCVAVVFV
jgi:hypothetical protein